MFVVLVEEAEVDALRVGEVGKEGVAVAADGVCCRLGWVEWMRAGALGLQVVWWIWVGDYDGGVEVEEI